MGIAAGKKYSTITKVLRRPVCVARGSCLPRPAPQHSCSCCVCVKCCEVIVLLPRIISCEATTAGGNVLQALLLFLLVLQIVLVSVFEVTSVNLCLEFHKG